MTSIKSRPEIEIPDFFDPEKVAKVWRVPYQERADQAREWAQQHAIQPAAADRFKTLLLLVDVQNTFCIPDFELFVGGRTGRGAVDDNRRLCEFIYKNLARITRVAVTMDTHFAMQIFHPIMLVDQDGRHPQPYTLVTYADVSQGSWRFNPAVADMLGIDPEFGQQHLEHYTRQLKDREKFDLTIWPYHSMLGGIGHSLVSSVEEALFFHSLARYSQPEIEIKGKNPLTEHYSAVGPEVQTGPDGVQLAEKSDKLLTMIEQYDLTIIAGQAKSHCVAWTVSDLLDGIRTRNEDLAQKVYLLEDCSSPVVVPGVIDYTDAADAEFRRFSEAGMRLVRSTDPMDTWPGLN
jgi:nicotinamidase-related amidase